MSAKRGELQQAGQLPARHAGRSARIGRRGLMAGLGALAGLVAPPAAFRAWGRSAIVEATGFGAVPDGRSDATRALQAAADAVPQDGTLHLSPGRFRLTSTLLLRSGTTLTGPGATLFAADEWRRALPGRDGRSPGRALVGNAGHGGDAIVDHDITVRDIHFQYVGEQHGDAHAVRFRQARRIRVLDCSFAGGGNGTAFLACRDTEVLRCRSQGTFNCAFDHWEGTSDSLVKDCEASCARGYGILFTGVGTAPDNHRHAARLSAIGNRIQAATQAGIWVCALSKHSAVTDVVIRGNTVRGGMRGAAGIGGTGDVSNFLIEGNTILNIKAANAIFLRSDEWKRPRGNRILGNRMVRCTAEPGQVALIQAMGDEVEVRGNRAEASSYPSLVWTRGEGVVLADNGGDTATSSQKYRTTGSTGLHVADP